jgi:hypothetical protein
MKNLVGKRMSQKFKFMGEQVEIVKLSVHEVMEIQEAVKALEGNEQQGLETLKVVIRIGVPAAAELSDEDFDTFPLDELSKLSNEIMKFSGIGGDKGNAS